MKSSSRSHKLEELLHANQRRLHLLEKQAAQFGAHADPSLLIEIEDLRNTIARLEQSHGIRPPSPQNDSDPLSTQSPVIAQAGVQQFRVNRLVVVASGVIVVVAVALVILAQLQAGRATPAQPTAIADNSPKATAAGQALIAPAAPASMTSALAAAGSGASVGTPTKESADQLLQEASAWPVVYSETFAGTVNGWSLGPRRSERVAGNRSIVAGRYLWEITALRDEVWWSTPPGNTDSFADFSMSIDVKRVSGPQSSYTGIAFRYESSDKLYAVFMREETQRISFSIYQRGKWEDLFTTSTSALKTDQPNTIRVIAKGALFVVLVNGQYVGVVADQRISSGRIYLITVLARANDSVAFEFDNFELRKP